ncbi:MAG TPA: protoheme IX farnesyltransferase, partial [Chloroflexia bacterium]|nr:protoheme IX farnesyltransferase [Chloroflexia bacterium]
PVVRGAAVTRRSILVYTVLLLGVTLTLFVTQALGGLYLAGALGLGTLFVGRAAQLVRLGTTARAWRLFQFSNLYLALLYAIMVLDRVLAALAGLPHGT